MSDNRLILDELVVDRFGGLGHRTIALPHDGFTVVNGLNESGKSTISELLAWLIAGPAGNAKDAQRFGHPDELIGGTLKGRLRGETFTARGKFKVLKNGSPNVSGLTVDMGGTLQAAQWFTALGSIDPTVLAAIYRVRGESLHEGSNVEEHVSKVALSAFAGRIDAHSLIDELLKDRQKLTTGKAVGVTSVATLAEQIKVAKGALDAAGGNADEHARVAKDHQRLVDERAAALAELEDARRRVRVAATVLSTVSYQKAIVVLRLELEGLAVVPDEWQSLVDDPTQLENAIEARREAEQLATGKAATATATAARLGCSLDRLSTVTITEGTLIEVALASEAMSTAKEALTAAETASSAAGTAAGEASANADRTLGAIGATRDQVAVADLSTHSGTAYTTALSAWRLAIGAAATKQSSVDDARRDGVAAQQRRVAAEQAWDRRGTGMPAEAWLQAQMTGTKSTGRKGVEPRLIAGGVLLAVAVIAAVVGQWVSAAAALVGAVAGFVLLGRAAGGSEMVVDEVARAEAVDAANAVRSTRADETQRAGAVATAEQELTAAGHAVARAAQDAKELAAQLRFPSADSPDASQAIHERWTAAAGVIATETAALDVAGGARQGAVDAEGKVRSAVAALESIIQSCGLADLATPANVGDTAKQYRDAALIAHDALAAADDLAAADQQTASLLQHVSAQTTGWRTERVLEEALALRALRDQRAEVEGKLASAARELQVAIGDDDEVKARATEPLNQDALESERQQADDAAKAAEDQAKRFSEEIGKRDQTMRQLAEVDRLAALNDELGALREQQEELAVNAATVALTAALLNDITAEYERTHQPELVAEASTLACSVAPLWSGVFVQPVAGGGFEVEVDEKDRGRIPATALSTGARALLYLAFRLALADHDAVRKNLRLPLLCDDPLVHLDDQRASQVIPLLAGAAERGHQVLLFTCQQRTVDVARSAGATIVDLG